MITTRPARTDELAFLQAKLAQRTPYEQVELAKSVVFVAEEDGVVVGMAAARLTWQIEPLFLFRDFESAAPLAALKRATLLLGKAIVDYIGDRSRNMTGLHWFFCHIEDRRFQYLARRFGLVRIYRNGKFFAGGT